MAWIMKHIQQTGLRLALGLLLAPVLAACTTPSQGTAGREAPTPVSATPAANSAPSPAPATNAAAFPVTIAHKFGSTTIPAPPQRVVALGYNDQDALLALGVTPLAVRYWFGPQTQQVWPWAQEKLNGPQPQVLNMPFGELNFEQIAALRPDLIVAVGAGITAEEYATLSAIAPTLAQSDAYVDFGMPWQEQTLVIGRALGAETRARELVTALEQRFAQVRAQHPNFADATVAIAMPSSDGQVLVSGPQHERQRVLSALGLQLPAELAQLAGDQFYGTLSGERLDLLDTDVLIWTVSSAAERATIENNPIYQQLDVAREGRAIVLDSSGNDGLVGPALVFSSVLSLPLVLDELTPQIAAALERAAAGATHAAPREEARR